MSQPLLRVRGLNVWYELRGRTEVHAVRDVDLDLDEGERVGLVGESGSGKTSVIMALMGLLPSTGSLSGEVLLSGERTLERGERSARASRWRHTAMVFQGAMNALNPVKTVGWQIIEPMLVHGVADKGQATRRTHELLERVGLPGATARRYPHELSGGMRQRACVAMALACRPKVLLADEPTTALDVVIQAQIIELLDDVASELGMGVIVVTHDLPVVARLCPRAAVMYAGEVVESGPTDALFHSPRHPYTKRLFEAVPDLSLGEEVSSIPGSPPQLDRPIVGCSFAPRCDLGFERCTVERPRLRLVTPDQLAACHLNEMPSEQVAPASSHELGPQQSEPDAAHATCGPATRRDPLLRLSEIQVKYALRRGPWDWLGRRPREYVRAVDGVSLEVRRGEMLALIGESGCGKTSTAQAILRLVEPASGTVEFDGAEVTRLTRRALRPLRRRVQMIYQDPYDSLDPRLNVRGIVEDGLVANRLGDRSERNVRVRRALERVELSPPERYLERLPHELSGGQRQRVAIASALVLEPELLVADEPVSMLDVSVRAGILSLLSRLCHEDGTAVVMITHDLSTAAHFADRVAVMYLGRVVEIGTVREVIRAPRHPYTKVLLSAVPDRDPCVRARPILLGEAPSAAMIPSGCRFHPRCPMAEPTCSELDPQLEPAKGHRVACTLAPRLQTAPAAVTGAEVAP